MIVFEVIEFFFIVLFVGYLVELCRLISIRIIKFIIATIIFILSINGCATLKESGPITSAIVSGNTESVEPCLQANNILFNQSDWELSELKDKDSKFWNLKRSV